MFRLRWADNRSLLGRNRQNRNFYCDRHDYRPDPDPWSGLWDWHSEDNPDGECRPMSHLTFWHWHEYCRWGHRGLASYRQRLSTSLSTWRSSTTLTLSTKGIMGMLNCGDYGDYNYSFSIPGWQQNRSRSWWDASTPTSSTARSRRGWAGTPWGRRYRCHPSASPTSRPRVNPLLPIPARSQAPAWRFLGLLMTYQGHFMKMFLRIGKILLMLVCWLTLT